MSFVWLPELYPMICHTSFVDEIYPISTHALAYNQPKTIQSGIQSRQIKLDDDISFSISPALPKSMHFDSKTGSFSGSFVFAF